MRPFVPRTNKNEVALAMVTCHVIGEFQFKTRRVSLLLTSIHPSHSARLLTKKCYRSSPQRGHRYSQRQTSSRVASTTLEAPTPTRAICGPLPLYQHYQRHHRRIGPPKQQKWLISAAVGFLVGPLPCPLDTPVCTLAFSHICTRLIVFRLCL